MSEACLSTAFPQIQSSNLINLGDWKEAHPNYDYRKVRSNPAKLATPRPTSTASAVTWPEIETGISRLDSIWQSDDDEVQGDLELMNAMRDIWPVAEGLKELVALAPELAKSRYADDPEYSEAATVLQRIAAQMFLAGRGSIS
jgi:hypothetical protein